MRFLRYLTLAGILAVMIWIGATSDQWRHGFSFTGQKADYYNLLVDGLRDGHLHMKVDPHPDLLSEDPAVRATAPYLLDASLYRGRYYLYFGVVPAVMLFLPYAVFTGHDLAQNVAVILLVWGGFLLQYRIFRAAKARYFAQVPRGVNVAAVLLLAFGAGTLVLVRTSGMYEIAIAGGYFFLSLCWWALFAAIHHPSRASRWLILASVAGGLAVGCRPPLFVVLAAVGVVALWRAFAVDTVGQRVRVLGAAIIPAGLIGVLLMIYNHARFGDPFEFGFNYALAALISGGFPIAQWSFLPSNLLWYYGLPPALTPHFPFVEPLDAVVRPENYYGYEAIYGQALILWLAGLSGGALLWLRRVSPLRANGLVGFLALTFGGFLALLFLLSLFGFRADRYVVDFHGTLVLMAAMGGAYACAHVPSRPGRLLRRVWVALALLASLFNVLLAIDHMHLFRNTRPQSYQAMAYVANHPSGWLAEAGLWHYGPVAFETRFDDLPEGKQIPVLTTGQTREVDGLFVTRMPGDELEFFFVHQGYGIPARGRTAFTPGQSHRIELHMGSLYPPRWHPFFRGWSEPQIEAAKLSLRLLFDGQEVIDGLAQFYDASPWHREWGSSPLEPANRFPHRLNNREMLSAPRAEATRVNSRGLWRLKLELRKDLAGLAQPILGSGVTGAGNLLILVVQPDGGMQFRLDQWGYGLSESPVVPTTSDQVTVEVLVWPRLLEQEWPVTDDERPSFAVRAEQLEVWVEGERVWSETLRLHQSTYGNVALGTNAQGFSTAAHVYHGLFRQEALDDEQHLELLRRSLAAPAP